MTGGAGRGWGEEPVALRTEPLPCGTGRYLWADAVRAELKSGTPCWCLRTVCWRGDLGLGTQFTDSLHTAELSKVGRPGDLPQCPPASGQGQGQGGRSRLLRHTANVKLTVPQRCALPPDGSLSAQKAPCGHSTPVCPLAAAALRRALPLTRSGPPSHSLGLTILCFPVFCRAKVNTKQTKCKHNQTINNEKHFSPRTKKKMLPFCNNFSPRD